MVESRYADQVEHFDAVHHQYPREAILRPPLHTAIELERLVRSLRGVPSDERILDFGAGSGRLSIALAKQGHAVLSVDISEQSLASLRTLAHELDLHSIETATSLPTVGSFPAIVGSDILHHVELDEYLPQLHALLRDGGKAVFSEPGALNPSWYALFLLRRAMQVERRIVHCNLRTLRKAFERHGFRDVRFTGVGLLPRPFFGWGETACRLHDRSGDLPLLKWFSYRFLIEATK
jgi:2-polyprenyl-3-methyl-5-hydroxy-6-metoxy-1,4-benzoquinol methylase